MNGEQLEVVGGPLPYIQLQNGARETLGWIEDKDIPRLKTIVDEIARKCALRKGVI
jgi:hypothetical protein